MGVVGGEEGGGLRLACKKRKKKEKKNETIKVKNIKIRKGTGVEIISMSRASSQKQDVAEQLTVAQLLGL